MYRKNQSQEVTKFNQKLIVKYIIDLETLPSSPYFLVQLKHPKLHT